MKAPKCICGEPREAHEPDGTCPAHRASNQLGDPAIRALEALRDVPAPMRFLRDWCDAAIASLQSHGPAVAFCSKHGTRWEGGCPVCASESQAATPGGDDVDGPAYGATSSAVAPPASSEGAGDSWLPCPFCGCETAETIWKGHRGCSNEECGAYHANLTKEQWNHRAGMAITVQTTEPAAGDIEAIKARNEHGVAGVCVEDALTIYSEDVSTLLAEVERLKDDRDDLDTAGAAVSELYSGLQQEFIVMQRQRDEARVQVERYRKALEQIANHEETEATGLELLEEIARDALEPSGEQA